MYTSTNLLGWVEAVSSHKLLDLVFADLTDLKVCSCRLQLSQAWYSWSSRIYNTLLWVFVPICLLLIIIWRACGRHYVTSRKIAGSSPDEAIEFFNWFNRCSRITALGSTRPLTEMSTGIFLGGQGRPVRKADCGAGNSSPNIMFTVLQYAGKITDSAVHLFFATITATA
jgi:hypothetical protein